MKGWTVVFFFFLAVAWVGSLAAEELPQPSSVIWRNGQADSVDSQLENLSRAFVQLAEKVRPGVVQIRVTARATPAGNDGAQTPSNSRGSGFIIDPHGYILTAHHVIDGAKEIEVRLGDRRRLRAKLIASEPRVDLALLKIDGKGALPLLDLGDSGPTKVDS